MRNDSMSERCILGAIFCKKDFEPIWPHEQQAKALLEEDWWWGEQDFIQDLIKHDPDYFVFKIAETKKPKYKLFYIGRPWNTIQLDETGAEFRDSVTMKLESIFNKPISISTYVLPEEDY